MPTVPSGSALFGLVLALSGCRPEPAPDAPRARWSLLVAVPDTVLVDSAGVEWVSSDARVWLRRRHAAPGSVAVVETKHDVSCERREIRDLAIRTVGVADEVVSDSAVLAPSWIPASAHPALRDLLPALCARLSQVNPRGLHNLLGSDRP
jgi:hypothetical protein